MDNIPELSELEPGHIIPCLTQEFPDVDEEILITLLESRFEFVRKISYDTMALIEYFRKAFIENILKNIPKSDLTISEIKHFLMEDFPHFNQDLLLKLIERDFKYIKDLCDNTEEILEYFRQALKYPLSFVDEEA